MHELPTDVKIGMNVYGRDNNLIGKVGDLRFAAPAAAEGLNRYEAMTQGANSWLSGQLVAVFTTVLANGRAGSQKRKW